MTFSEYQEAVNRQIMGKYPHFRKGQCYYNTLDARRPDLAFDVPWDLDPFYNDELIYAFLQWVEDHWDNPPKQT
jgi:hypothetical protein